MSAMKSNIVEEVTYRGRNLIFKDRLDAGGRIADKLTEYEGTEALILAVPSGGVPIGYAIARKLKMPFDIIVVRKIQIPWNTEAGFGAVTWDGEVLLNEQLLKALGLSSDVVDLCISQTQGIVRARLQKFRGDRPFPNLKDRTSIVVDDGLASGFTMLAAVKALRRRSPRRIVVAVPTGSESAVGLLADSVDEIVCLNIRGGPTFAVADAYLDWYDVPDEEVLRYLALTHSA
jgi:putative phosphoribosyl transferase